jgi:hypothetical protein
MNAAAAIRRALPILAEHGAGDQSLARVSLIRGGLSRPDAAAAVRFVPLALGRAILLEGLGVVLSDTYLLRNDAAGTREEKNLADEAFFAETMRLAPALGAELGIDVVSAVALQSSEVQAVNAALNAGAQAEDLVASLPVVTWEDGIDNAPKPPRWKFWA